MSPTQTGRRAHARLISADKLKAAMTRRDVSIRALAKRAGCSHNTVWLLLHGRMEFVSLPLAGRIERGLTVAQGSLFMPTTSNVKFHKMTLDRGEIR